MSNRGHIYIPSEQRLATEKHSHLCPLCKRIVPDQPNVVCQKTLAGTGLEHHVFPCVNCADDWRCRFDIADLVDVYLEPNQARRFVHEVPREQVRKREEREAVVNPDMRDVLKEPE